MNRLDWMTILAATAAISISCGTKGHDDSGQTGVEGSITVTVSDTGADSATTSADSADSNDVDTGEKLDVGAGNTAGMCNQDLGCTDQIDLLFVIDNSGTMGQEQENLARNFPLLIQQLETLTDSDGNMVMPDVNI